MQGTPQKFGNRLGNRKTTTGCITCKTRHVKCDEGRPSCRRCTSTGRRCDGYRDSKTSLERKVQNDSTVIGHPDLYLSGSRLSDHESHVLHFFVDQATVQLAGWSGTDFWSSLVPQLSQHYHAIQYATVALGSLLLQQQTRATQPIATEAFALQHYGKAIQTTLSTIRDGGANELLASVTCILFVCIEALQGHEEQAISFFRQGRVSVLQSDDTNSTISCRVPENHALQRAEMRTMFKRLAVQFMMFGPSNEDLAVTHQAAFLIPVPILSQPFQSLIDAEDELLNLLSIVQGIALAGKKLKWGQMNKLDRLQFSTLCSRQQLIHCALSRWYTRFQELVSRSADGTVATIQSRIGASMILQQYHIMQIWLSGSLEIDECFYDRFMPQFEIIVAEAISCAELMAESEDKIRFRLDMGWIPPLYWTALKCRDPSLRRRAVSLLDVGPRQEGLWNAQLVKRVALRVIELEEDGIKSSLVSNDESESPIMMPSEENRIKAVRINLRTTAHGQKGDFTEFLTLPDGQDGEWHVRREFFPV